MKAKSFGKIPVPTPGTPVPVTSDTNLRVERMRFAAAIGDTGRVFLGVSGMNKANVYGRGQGVLSDWMASTNSIVNFSLET